jgi:cyclopropane fatty-acyl-phospholipid synthase-like methyltransferase
MDEKVKDYWNMVYKTKNPDQVSWTQKIPQPSLDFIHSFHLPKTAKIIDIGSGDSLLVDYLLEEGFENITLLDISEKALDKVKMRLGEKAEKVHWVVSDIAEFQSDTMFDLWHDRATFHFLTTNDQISRYLERARKLVSQYLVIGTFSEKGPEKCSGLPIRKYDPDEMSVSFSDGFKKITCMNADHETPFGTKQNFTYCSFRRI